MFWRSDAAIHPVVGEVNPVIDSKAGVSNACFRIYFRKSCVEYSTHIGFAVAIGIFEIEDIGGAGDNQTALPWKNSTYFENMIRKNRPLIRLSIAIGIFEHYNA